MIKPIFLFVGKSGSGKTTVANILERIGGCKQVQSYTTRQKRHDKETGHTFITNEEFDCLENIIAYTEYNGNRYCATKEQIDNSSIYVIDVDGVETLLQNYNTDRPIVVLYFKTSIRTRIDRMLDRHDSDMLIVSRIYNDEEFDWENSLSKIVWNYKNNMEKNVVMYTIDANQSIDGVLEQVSDAWYNMEEN